MATTAATAAPSMKLLIDGKAQRVLFTEASKDVVDFLFSLLAMPLATAVKLVGKEAMVGYTGNLYASVDKLGSTTNVLTGAARDGLLCPAVMSPAAAATTGTDRSLLLRLSPAPPFVQVRGNMTSYRVRDDLTMDPTTPMSAISSISLLSTFGLNDLSALQQKTVQLGYNEGLAILKAILQSSTVLTDVFLHGNGNKQAVSSTPIVGTSSGYQQDGVAVFRSRGSPDRGRPARVSSAKNGATIAESGWALL